jgi:hypothetical protein
MIKILPYNTVFLYRGIQGHIAHLPVKSMRRYKAYFSHYNRQKPIGAAAGSRDFIFYLTAKLWLIYQVCKNRWY